MASRPGSSHTLESVCSVCNSSLLLSLLFFLFFFFFTPWVTFCLFVNLSLLNKGLEARPAPENAGRGWGGGRAERSLISARRGMEICVPPPHPHPLFGGLEGFSSFCSELPGTCRTGRSQTSPGQLAAAVSLSAGSTEGAVGTPAPRGTREKS